MNDFLSDLGIKPENKEERKEIDLAVREAIGKKVLINVMKSGKRLKSG
jgi:hypothetical protein